MGDNSYNNLTNLEYVPYHKIGFKILNNSQLNILFPNYVSLLEKIENHRNMITKFPFPRLEKNEQYNLMYDNIFSIMGKRGSGKTSVIFTLQKIIENSNPGDIVLPIVMPDIIPEKCSMIGWILSLLESKINYLQEKIDEFDKKNDFFSDCRINQMLLKNQYNKVKELAYSQLYSLDRTSSLSDAIFSAEQQTQNSYDFAKQLVVFWNKLIEAIKIVNSHEQLIEEEIKEPLIYIIFDDVDLMPNMTITLLRTIVKYLSHPNIIVIITGDEELIYDVVENNMNSNMNSCEEFNSYGSISKLLNENKGAEAINSIREINRKWNTIHDLPKKYVDKILPPASRYYLEEFESNIKKSNFVERVVFNADKKEINVTLENFMRELITGYSELVGNKKDIFLYYKGKLITAYFMFWGETSRQLANESFILEDFVNALTRIYQFRRQTNYDQTLDYGQGIYNQSMYNCVYNFAYNTLHTNGRFHLTSQDIKNLLENLIIQNVGRWPVYIDYEYLKEYSDSMLENPEINDIKHVVTLIITIFVLMFFIENMLAIENPERKIHGQRQLIQVLDSITPNDYSLIRSDEGETKTVDRFLAEYGRLLEHADVFIRFNPTEVSVVRKYFLCLPEDMDAADELIKYVRRNPKWFKTMSQILFLRNAGIFELNERNLPYFFIQNYDFFIYDNHIESMIKKVYQSLIKDLLTPVSSGRAKNYHNDNITYGLVDLAEDIVNSLKDEFYYKILDEQLLNEHYYNLQHYMYKRSLPELQIKRQFIGDQEVKTVKTSEINSLVKEITNSIANYKNQLKITENTYYITKMIDSLQDEFYEICKLLKIVPSSNNNHRAQLIDYIESFINLQSRYMSYQLMSIAHDNNKHKTQFKQYSSFYNKIQNHISLEDNKNPFLDDLVTEYVTEAVKLYLERFE